MQSYGNLDISRSPSTSLGDNHFVESIISSIMDDGLSLYTELPNPESSLRGTLLTNSDTEISALDLGARKYLRSIESDASHLHSSRVLADRYFVPEQAETDVIDDVLEIIRLINTICDAEVFSISGNQITSNPEVASALSEDQFFEVLRLTSAIVALGYDAEHTSYQDSRTFESLVDSTYDLINSRTGGPSAKEMRAKVGDTPFYISTFIEVGLLLYELYLSGKKVARTIGDLVTKQSRPHGAIHPDFVSSLRHTKSTNTHFAASLKDSRALYRLKRRSLFIMRRGLQKLATGSLASAKVLLLSAGRTILSLLGPVGTTILAVAALAFAYRVYVDVRSEHSKKIAAIKTPELMDTFSESMVAMTKLLEQQYTVLSQQQSVSYQQVVPVVNTTTAPETTEVQQAVSTEPISVADFIGSWTAQLKN